MSETEPQTVELTYEAQAVSEPLSTVLGYVTLKMVGLYLLYMAIAPLPFLVFSYAATYFQSQMISQYYSVQTNAALMASLVFLLSGLVLVIYAKPLSKKFLLPFGTQVTEIVTEKWIYLSVWTIGLLMAVWHLPQAIIYTIDMVFYVRQRNTGSPISESIVFDSAIQSFAIEIVSLVLGLMMLLRPGWFIRKIKQFAPVSE